MLQVSKQLLLFVSFPLHSHFEMAQQFRDEEKLPTQELKSVDGDISLWIDDQVRPVIGCMAQLRSPPVVHGKISFHQLSVQTCVEVLQWTVAQLKILRPFFSQPVYLEYSLGAWLRSRNPHMKLYMTTKDFVVFESKIRGSASMLSSPKQFQELLSRESSQYGWWEALCAADHATAGWEVLDSARLFGIAGFRTRWMVGSAKIELTVAAAGSAGSPEELPLDFSLHGPTLLERRFSAIQQVEQRVECPGGAVAFIPSIIPMRAGSDIASILSEECRVILSFQEQHLEKFLAKHGVNRANEGCGFYAGGGVKRKYFRVSGESQASPVHE